MISGRIPLYTKNNGAWVFFLLKECILWLIAYCLFSSLSHHISRRMLDFIVPCCLGWFLWGVVVRRGGWFQRQPKGFFFLSRSEKASLCLTLVTPVCGGYVFRLLYQRFLLILESPCSTWGCFRFKLRTFWQFLSVEDNALIKSGIE